MDCSGNSIAGVFRVDEVESDVHASRNRVGKVRADF